MILTTQTFFFPKFKVFKIVQFFDYFFLMSFFFHSDSLKFYLLKDDLGGDLGDLLAELIEY